MDIVVRFFILVETLATIYVPIPYSFPHARAHIVPSHSDGRPHPPAAETLSAQMLEDVWKRWSQISPRARASKSLYIWWILIRFPFNLHYLCVYLNDTCESKWITSGNSVISNCWSCTWNHHDSGAKAEDPLSRAWRSTGTCMLLSYISCCILPLWFIYLQQYVRSYHP